MKAGTCLLCGKIAELSGMSHIIPKFMYKGMEDDRNKIALSILKNNIKRETEIDYRYFDKNIICLHCETVTLSQLDNYGNRILFGDQKTIDSFQTKVFQSLEAKVCVIKNFEYEKLKLFLLSILWRSHISQLSFFKEINLGLRAEILRKSIITGNPELSNVKISLFGLMFNPSKIYKIVSAPRHIVQEGLDVYSFIIYGIVYNFIYKDINNLFQFGENHLNANQLLKIPFYMGADAANFCRAFVLPKSPSLV